MKNNPVPRRLIDIVRQALDKAIAAKPASTLATMSEAKLYELLVLGKLLQRHRHPARHQPRKNGVQRHVVVAQNPASADKSKFSHFVVAGSEAWVSLNVKTLSWHLGQGGGRLPFAARHELDVAFVRPGCGPYPAHSDLYLGASCKHVAQATKAQVRETLGLRRETAMFQEDLPSLARWFVREVPASPASPMLLASSNPDVLRYAKPVDRLGVYLRYVPFR